LRSVATKLLAAALLTVVLGGLAYLRSFPPMATVMSDSMQPEISVGDIVLFKSLGGTPPSLGDVVQISVPSQLQHEHGYPSTVIHRVVGINDDGTVTTRGDNLQNEDPFTTKTIDIERKVQLTVPMAGRALGFVFSPFGLLWLGLGLVIFVVMPFYDVQRERAALQQLEVAAIGELAQPQPDERIEQLVAAVTDYGNHLRSHTAIVRSMSDASRGLAAVVAQLQSAKPPPPVMAPEPLALTSARILVTLARIGGSEWSEVLVDDIATTIGPPGRRSEVMVAMHHLDVTGSIELELAGPGRYRYRLA
jgi:signal peptidase I